MAAAEQESQRAFVAADESDAPVLERSVAAFRQTRHNLQAHRSPARATLRSMLEQTFLEVQPSRSKPPSVPSAAMTRWQGTTKQRGGPGRWALPTALAAPGRPRASRGPFFP